MQYLGSSAGGAVDRYYCKISWYLEGHPREFVNKTVNGRRRPFSELCDMRARHFALAALASVLCLCQSYTLRSSVSWVASSNAVVEDADLSEEDAPALWKQAYTSSDALGDGVEKRDELDESGDEDVAQLSSRLFSYRLEKVKKNADSSPPPPPQRDTARTARYVAHFSVWGHLATISSQDKIKGLPFGNICPVSDGPRDHSTGVPYFYVTPMDDTVSGLKTNPYASLTLSEPHIQLPSLLILKEMLYNPEVPRCALLTLTGKMVEVDPEELAFAKQAMFSRHPAMSKWPVAHTWFFMKMELIRVWRPDWVAGTSVIALEDYFEATPF